MTLAALALAPFVLGGCSAYFFGFVPQPVHADRVRAATEQERRRCDSQPVDARVYGPDVVESATPYYLYVQNGGSRAAILHGAEVRIRPLPGMTPELITRVISCRSAQLVLGHAQPADDEPYWLPDGWVKIDVRSDDGSFVVALDGEDLPEAKEILARAQAFAARAKR